MKRRKFERKEKRKFSYLLALGIIILCGVAIVVFGTSLKLYQTIFANPFEKKTLVVPLPKTDPGNELKKVLSEKGFLITRGPFVYNDSIEVTLDSGTTVIFNEFSDYRIQVESLQMIKSRLTMEGKVAKRIDLRYEEPTVIY